MKAGVIGLGLTGLSVLRYLMPRGEAVWAWDTRPAQDVSAVRERWPSLSVYVGDALPTTAWDAVDTLVISPGLDPDDARLAPARRRGLPLIGDIELFARAARRPVIAITGTNGKSTVTTLAAELLNASGLAAAAGGNLGLPALDLLAQSPEVDVYVLELSSFQLETTASLASETAAILNFSEDHMDRYATLSDYAAAKKRILRGAKRQVLPVELAHWATAPAERTLRFGLTEPADENMWGVGGGWLRRGDERLFPLARLPDQTAHRVLNTLAALALTAPFGVTPQAIDQALSNFVGLPHRTESVARADGVEWINDSKGTNVGATQAALQSFSERGRVILLLGGVGKGQDFAPLAEQARRQADAVIVFGEVASELAELLHGHPACRQAETLPQALEEARRLAGRGRYDYVLFSPACASFDQFPNYKARGEAFREWVKQYVAGSGT